MYVNEAMTTAVLTCRPDSTLDKIARQMWEGDCGAIPVVNDDRIPIGMVTDRDIAMAAMLNRQPLWEISASTVIQGQSPCCCRQQDSLESCLDTMEQNGVRRIMVTDDAGILTGILSLGDAVAFTRSRQDGSRKSKARVDADHILGMLRKVSGHHPSQDHPVMRIN